MSAISALTHLASLRKPRETRHRRRAPRTSRTYRAPCTRCVCHVREAAHRLSSNNREHPISRRQWSRRHSSRSDRRQHEPRTSPGAHGHARSRGACGRRRRSAHPPAARPAECALRTLRRVADAGAVPVVRCGRRSHRVVGGARGARRSSGSARARPHFTAAARSCAGEQNEAAVAVVSGDRRRCAVEYVSGSEDINFGHGGVRPACSQRSQGRWPGVHSAESTSPQSTAGSPRSSGRSEGAASTCLLWMHAADLESL